jgi:hypothetical protein
MFFLWSALGWAEVPLPLYPSCGEPGGSGSCPSDLTDWYHFSHIPENAADSIRPAERELGSGNHVDRAFAYSTGRFDVSIAIIDSGVRWDHGDLQQKYYLHAPELPYPEDAVGESGGTHDLNGDGFFSLADYADDPRIDLNGCGVGAPDALDVCDVLEAFSDGVDDDGNGLVDDISGWDFFGRDNNAFHDFNDGFGTHGTGVAREAAAEGGNGGDIGVCPNCSIIPIRVGDTFISDGGRIAEAIVYATELGAASATLAVGSLSNADSTVIAAANAFDSGTLLVGASGDENSYHHNYPAALDNILYVHSITHNTSDNDLDVYSYMNTWNCNNFGSRINLVAASGACATGAVAETAGAIGLMQSMAKDQGYQMSAGEAYQLIVQTVDDVSLSSEEQGIAKSYPSHDGWDAFHGYGRLNVAEAVKSVSEGDFPPVATIDSPEWFETVDPAQRPVLQVSGTATSREGDASWSLRYGLGSDPGEWLELETGTGPDFSAELDLSLIPAVSVPEADRDELITERLERVNRPSVTLLLSVESPSGRQAEMRKTFFVHRDPDLKTGFPVRLSGSAEGSPVVYDLDGDSVFEIIVGDSGGNVHALDGAGVLLPGWPVQMEVRGDLEGSAIYDVVPVLDYPAAGIAAGDLDGDGDTEVVAAGFYGGIHAWHHDGSAVDGFPVHSIGRGPEEFDTEHSYDQGFLGAPALYDLDGSGSLEIIAAGMDSRLYVLDHMGKDWGPYPIEICAPELCGLQGYRIITSPAVGDVDGDGDIEIGFGSNEAVNNGNESIAYLIDALTGEPETGWPLSSRGLIGEAVLLPLIGEGHPSSLSFADIDGDGDLEISNSVMLGFTPPIHHDGSSALDISFVASDFSEDANTNAASLVQMTSNPVWGDLTGDGIPEYLSSGVSSIYLASLAMRQEMEYQQPVGAWDGVTGAFLPGWPRQVEDLQLLTGLAVADLTGDGLAEVLSTSGGYLTHAWDGEGREADGWPKFTGHWGLATPAVGDIDGDGYLDVVQPTREGWLFAWSTQGHADQNIEWAGLQHDAQNTGNYHHPLPVQAGPPETLPPEEGCCSRNGDKGAALFLFPVSLLALARRRRPGSP